MSLNHPTQGPVGPRSRSGRWLVQPSKCITFPYLDWLKVGTWPGGQGWVHICLDSWALLRFLEQEGCGHSSQNHSSLPCWGVAVWDQLILGEKEEPRELQGNWMILTQSLWNLLSLGFFKAWAHKSLIVQACLHWIFCSLQSQAICLFVHRVIQ